VVSFTPRPLYPQGKSPWFTSDRRLVGPRAGLNAVAKRKIPNPFRESNPSRPARSLVCILTYCLHWSQYTLLSVSSVSPFLVIPSISNACYPGPSTFKHPVYLVCQFLLTLFKNIVSTAYDMQRLMRWDDK
jgi:hypothetical protein